MSDPNDILALEDGTKVRITGYGSLTPEQQTQKRAQVETDMRTKRVQQGGGKLVHHGDKTRLTTPGSTMGNIADGLSSFRRGVTMGIPELISAGVTGIPALNPEGAPLHGLDFWERRDAIRFAEDFEGERALGDTGDSVAETAGNFFMGAARPAATAAVGMVPALKQGATVGAVAGTGLSDADSVPELALDSGLGTAAGAGGGAIADLLFNKIIGGTARKAFALKGEDGKVSGESGRLYDAQVAMGVPPTPGSIGTGTPASLENALAEAPLTAMVSRITPGRSAVQAHEQQAASMGNALRREVTDPIRGTPGAPATTDADMASDIVDYARASEKTARDKIQASENVVSQTVPPGSPVPMQGLSKIPTKMRDVDFRADELVKEMSEYVEKVRGDPTRRTPFNTQNDKKWSTEIAGLEGQSKQLKTQRDSLVAADGDPVQIRKLNRTLSSNQKKIDGLQAKIDANMAPPFQSVRDNRTRIGRQAAEGGFENLVEKELLGPMTKALETAAAKARGPKGRQVFREQMAVEKEMYDILGITKPYADKDAALSTIAPRVRRAVQKGNWEDLDAIASGLNPEQAKGLQSDLIDMLGRTPGQEGFNPSAYSKQWRLMPEEARQRLFAGNPEGLASAEALASVAKAFEARGRLANRSNSATAAGVLAGLGAAVGNPGKIMSFITTVTGVEKALVSEAMTKAVAGKPTELGQHLRRAVMLASGTYGPTKGAELLGAEE